jgi:hypothetical protein
MKTPPSLAAKVIETHQLNTLAAYDPQERLRLFYVEGTADELQEHLADLVRDLEGTFLVKAWKRGNPKGGRPVKAEQVYSWILVGRKPDQVEQPVQGTAIPSTMLDELATLRAEKLMRDRLDAIDQEEEDDEEDTSGPDPMGQLVGLLTNLLLPKAGPAATAPVTGAERGHPSSLQGERLEAIVNAIRNLHSDDPGTFAQYEQALLNSYGKTA